MRTIERKAVFGIFRHEATSPIDSLIDAVLEEMHKEGVNSDKYPDLLDHLKDLHEIKVKKHPSRVSPDTMAIIAGNLVGILLIIAYEQKHVMTTKALGQIIRPK